MNRRCIFLIFAFLVWPLPVLAHPHIFARYDVTIAPPEAGFIKLHFTFKIHALANPLLTPGPQSADNPVLARDMMQNIAAHPFFIYLDMDGQNIGKQQVRLAPSGKTDTQGDQIFTFDLTLPDSIGTFGFALYDPTYFDSVWQEDAQALQVKWDKIACAVQDQDITKTMWGMLRAQYVQCADKSGPRLPPRVLKNQAPAQPPAAPDFMGGRMVP
jgi:ABC-type uncharacterized transport system substrate-binding protein